MLEEVMPLEEWRRLYEAAIRVRDLAPWEWMAEDEIFGIQEPGTGQIGFVSVMGALGEHFAVAVYPGPQALYSFWDLVHSPTDDYPERVLEIPQLQASFESRASLHARDRQLIKALGLKFRGAHAWPMLRGYRPGFFPWFLEAHEARLLTYALEQLPGVALRFKDDPALLQMSNNVSYLVRAPRQAADGVEWEDRIVEVMPPQPVPITFVLDPAVLEELQRLPRLRGAVEMDFFLLPAPLRDGKDARPYFPYNLLLVDAHSGFVLGSEMLSPEPGLEAMWGQIPTCAARLFGHVGGVPGEIRLRLNLLAGLLRPLADKLHFHIARMRRLPMLDEAKQALFQFMERG